MSSAESWVYFFSRFTPEALLFEALLIFILLSAYAAFWILRKRRYGVVEHEMPAGPVRVYLNELINNAEQLRAQLFGLIAHSEGSHADLTRSISAALQGMPQAPGSGATAAGPALSAADPAVVQKLVALETKMTEQTKALEGISAEKAKLEQELTEARKAAASGSAAAAAAAGGKGGAVSAADAGKIDELNKKIAELEGKLAEYSVIEDDLANLKRLQQENTQLKKLLADKGGSLGSLADVAPAAAAATPASPVETPAPKAATAEAAPEAAFDALAAQVEQSLAPAAAPATPADAPAAPAAEPAAAAPAAAASAPAGATSAATPAPTPAAAPGAEGAPADAAAAGAAPAAEPSEADLVAEFEKMLKG